MECYTRLLTVIANVNTHLELLAHDSLDGRLHLAREFGLVNRRAALLTEQ
jgi:hypothetical protein